MPEDFVRLAIGAPFGAARFLSVVTDTKIVLLREMQKPAREAACGYDKYRRVPPAFMARLPPSIGMRAPVTQVLLSLARKTARPWMSSGWPIRPRGMPERNLSFRPGSAAIRFSRLGLVT